MIYGIIHKGSGLGNQLFRYVATRSLAEQKGYDFGMIAQEEFKGASFMDLKMGKELPSPYKINFYSGKVTSYSDLPLWEEKTNYYNPEFNFIEDNTIIDGEFQDERYFDLFKVNDWLKTEPLDVPDDVCAIGFRGGEFTVFPELYLPKEYWLEAVYQMKNINSSMKFEVHTDDPVTAKQMFPDFKVIHDIGINWRSIRYARYAIIANSSFYILPRLLRQQEDNSPVPDNGINYVSTQSDALTIAPRYWARHNTKEWSMPQNYYKSFKYI